MVAGHWLVPPMHMMSLRISGSAWIIFESTLYAGYSEISIAWIGAVDTEAG